MSCFSCLSSREKEVASNSTAPPRTEANEQRALIETAPKDTPPKEAGSNNYTAVQTFTFQELATATENFRQECLIEVGGFGRVYKGRLDKTGQAVAVKQLDRKGLQGNREFLVEVLMLSTLHHENLVNLIGYCTEGEQRLLVFEYMPHGSLEDHLLVLGPIQKPLDWFTRMKIALGVAKGLVYLHNKANPPVIYRNLKPSNILLDSQFNAKLSDFGLAKLGPVGDRQHVSTRVVGTYGYCAPEYQSTGQLTVKSDVYSFGVVLLELITGRRAIDTTRPTEEQNLVTWVQPVFKDLRRYPELADPLLNNDFPLKGLNQAVAVAAMCLDEDMAVRPLMTDVMTALSYLWLGPGTGTVTVHTQSPQSDHNVMGGDGKNQAEDGTGTVEHEPTVAGAIEWDSNSRRNASSLGGSVSSL